MEPIFLPLILVGGLYILWILYLAVMNLKRARDADLLTPVALWLGYPILIIGVVLDIAFNFLFFSPLILDFSVDLTITGHINYILRKGKPWQKKIALWICHHLLDAFDPNGYHCKRSKP